jgi:hypothetical protein
MDQPFEVRSVGVATLKLTAKEKVLDAPFGAKIIEPYIKHVNKKQPADAQLTLASFESAVLRCGTAEVFSFTVSEAEPALTVSATVRSVVPAGAEGETLGVELFQRATRALKITCAGVSLSANLPAQHVHLSLHETVVKQFLMDYNNKLNSERPAARIHAVARTRDPRRGADRVL